MDNQRGNGERNQQSYVGEEGRDDRGCPFLPQLIVGSSSRNTSQMIIYYAGSLRIFDSVTPEKAQAITLIAAAAEAAGAVPETTRTLSIGSTTEEVAVARAPPQKQLLVSDTAHPLSRLQAAPGDRSLAELPLARRNSLQRFLEKRRERLVNKNPHLVTKLPESLSGSCSRNEPSTPSSSS